MRDLTSGGFNVLSFALLPYCTTLFGTKTPDKLLPRYDRANFVKTVDFILDSCPDVNTVQLTNLLGNKNVHKTQKSIRVMLMTCFV